MGVEAFEGGVGGSIDVGGDAEGAGVWVQGLEGFRGVVLEICKSSIGYSFEVYLFRRKHANLPSTN